MSASDTFFQTYCYVFIVRILEKVLQESVENLYLHFKIKKKYIFRSK